LGTAGFFVRTATRRPEATAVKHGIVCEDAEICSGSFALKGYIIKSKEQ
jgi:hypothetical protein